MTEFKYKVNNLPAYYKDHEYVVITIVDGEYWFYGAYDDDSQIGAWFYEAPRLLVHSSEVEPA